VCGLVNAKCTPGGRDYVEVLGGSGLDTSTMTRFVAMCGLQAERGTQPLAIVGVAENTLKNKPKLE